MPAEKLVTNYQPLADELSEGVTPVAECSVLSVTVQPGCEDVADNYSFQFIAEELVANCAEKDTHDIQIGLQLTYDEPTGTYRLVVEDNVRYSPQELKRVLANLNRVHSKQEGKNGKRKAHGTLGKSMIENNLQRWGGGLTYEGSADGRIVAVAQWTREGYLNPLPQTRQPTYIRTV